MKLKKLLCVLMSVCMVFVVVACGAATDSNSKNSNQGSSNNAGGQSAKEIVLKFGHVLAPSHPYNLGAEKFKEILETNAPQPVRVEIYHSSQLGNERDLTEGLQLGTVDLAIAPGTITSFEPKMKVFGLPFIFKSREHAYKVLDGEIGKELASNLPSVKLRLLAYWENGYRQITNSKKPIYTPEDLKGIKLRVPENKVYVDTFTQWGANVTTMAFGELYTALQQKTIDAQENSIALVYTNKLYEAQEYMSLSNHVYEPAPLLISQITWNKLSPEMQRSIQKAAEEARDYERKLLVDADKKYLEELKKEGMQVNEIDVEAFKKASEPVWDLYRNEFDEYIEKIQNLN
jgi:tripartite ATP-independent transporter DctP family solute receptor